MNKFKYHNCIGTPTNFHVLLYEITVVGPFLAIFIIINKDKFRIDILILNWVFPQCFQF